MCGEEAGGSQLRGMKGRFFFWRVTVQQSESTVFWVTWVWWPGCVAEKVGHHSIEGTKRKRKRML